MNGGERESEGEVALSKRSVAARHMRPRLGANFIFKNFKAFGFFGILIDKLGLVDMSIKSIEVVRDHFVHLNQMSESVNG